MKKFCLTLLVFTLFTGGCSLLQTNGEEQTKAASTEWRIASLEENFLNFKEDARKHESDFLSREKELSAQMQELSDRIENLSEEVAALQAMRIPPVEVTEETILTPGEVERGVVVGGKISEEERPWADVPGPKTSEPEAAAQPAPPPSPAKPKAEEQPKRTAQRAASPAPEGKPQYEHALALLRKSKPEPAREAFNAFLKAHPKSSLVPNALYWIGETYYDQKDYAQAILSFKDVPRRFPKHPKAAAALLKTAMSYEQLGDKNNAAFYLRALLADYPDSDPARMAKTKLSGLAG
jgi:tol-pal system protein YbgF